MRGVLRLVFLVLLSGCATLSTQQGAVDNPVLSGQEEVAGVKEAEDMEEALASDGNAEEGDFVSDIADQELEVVG